jgi:hypothetical protein
MHQHGIQVVHEVQASNLALTFTFGFRRNDFEFIKRRSEQMDVMVNFWSETAGQDSQLGRVR